VGAQPQSTDLVRAWEDSASSSAFHAEFDSAGSIANFYGFHSDIDVNSGHLLSLYHGVRIDLPTGSGSIDNAIGVMIRDLGNGPTINTESYALYIEDQSVNGSNTPYAIYQAGSDDVNYFAGQSEFAAITGVGGSPVSTAKLKVTDDSASGATLDVLEVEFNKTAAGVITAWRGVRLDPTVASGTVTTLTGVSIPAAQGAGTVTTYHGLEIFDLTSGPASGGTNYGIRQLGTSDKNRLEGQTGIGADYQADTQLFVDADYSGTIAATRNALRTQLDYTGSTTSLSDARVIHTDISAGSTATITNGYGLYVDSPTGAGTIAACTGIYIAAQETGPTTTGYGIWQNGSSDFNRFNGTTAFMGTVGLNDLTPNASYAMDAAGDINIQSGSVYRHNSLAGASGSFTTTDGKTVVVSGGIVTSIV
jgi:hypothetical protein